MDKMKPTEEMREEHKAIKLMLNILEKVCAKLKSKEELPYRDFDSILEFFQVFVDKCHHQKEEDLLFPEMKKTMVPTEDGLIDLLLTEHQKGRDYIKRISEAFNKYKIGKPAPKTDSNIIENTTDYIELLTRHINREDNTLFPIAEEKLSEEKQKELLNGFERLEEEKIGIGKHEEFHKTLHNLKSIYL
jgi:hemerythrin-like domain-containing protein